MKKLKFNKSYIIYPIVFILFIMIISVFIYIGLMPISLLNPIVFLTSSITSLILGIKKGKSTNKKGYIQGIKYGFIVILILSILNLIFVRTFTSRTLIYYLLILISTIIGSIVGINTKKG